MQPTNPQAPIPQTEGTPTADPQQPSPDLNIQRQSSPKKSKRKTQFLFGLSVVACIVIAGAIILLFNPNDKTKDSPASVSQTPQESKTVAKGADVSTIYAYLDQQATKSSVDFNPSDNSYYKANYVFSLESKKDREDPNYEQPFYAKSTTKESGRTYYTRALDNPNSIKISADWSENTCLAMIQSDEFNKKILQVFLDAGYTKQTANFQPSYYDCSQALVFVSPSIYCSLENLLDVNKEDLIDLQAIIGCVPLTIKAKDTKDAEEISTAHGFRINYFETNASKTAGYDIANMSGGSTIYFYKKSGSSWALVGSDFDTPDTCKLFNKTPDTRAAYKSEPCFDEASNKNSIVQ